MFLRRGISTKKAELYLVLVLLSIISAFFLYHLSTFQFNHFQAKIVQQSIRLGEKTLSKQKSLTIPKKTADIESFEFNVTSQGDSFDGYNIFVVQQANKSTPNEYNRNLLITDMSGQIIMRRDVGSEGDLDIRNVEFINSTTVLYGDNSGAAIWNIYTNISYHIYRTGHHEYEYNPNDGTIFTFEAYNIDIDGETYRFDYINEYDLTGHLVWSLDTRSFISITQWCPFKDMVGKNVGITHSNTLFFDAEEDVFYYNARNLNTFYKIDHKTSEVIWGLGQYGDFTLFDIEDNEQESLFFHPHAIEKIDDDQFILFDNDKHNLYILKTIGLALLNLKLMKQP